MTVLGQRIKYLRDKKNLSQKQLAKVLGITNAQLSRYETGDRNPDPEMIAHIANFFEVTTDYLLGRSNTPNKEKENMLLRDIESGKNDDEIIKKYDLLNKISEIEPTEQEVKAMIALVKMMREK